MVEGTDYIVRVRRGVKRIPLASIIKIELGPDSNGIGTMTHEEGVEDLGQTRLVVLARLLAPHGFKQITKRELVNMEQCDKLRRKDKEIFINGVAHQVSNVYYPKVRDWMVAEGRV